MTRLWLRFCVWASDRFLTRRPRSHFDGWDDCPGWLPVWAWLPKVEPPQFVRVQETEPLKGAPLVYLR